MRRVLRPIRLGAVGTCLLIAMTLAAAGPATGSSAPARPWMDRSLKPETRARLLLARMTLEEKVGQMTQAERGAVTGDPTLVATWRLGSVLSGGGSVPTPNTPEAWADMVDAFQAQALETRLGIPLIYGVDSVHGHGATRNPRLVEQVEHVTAAETRATGPQWVFAPCVCVARDLRWGRTYESFSENPGLVIKMETAIDGFQGRRARELSDPDRVLATAKHYAGDGDTEYGTGSGDYPIDQGITISSRPDFARIDLAPYVPAVREHRVGSVMPSFSSVDFTEDGVGNPLKMHAHRALITGVLKHKIGFDGFVISDWEGIHQIPGDYPTQVRTGVNAGIDMFMEPFSYQDFETTLLAEVAAGRVSQARIDDAVRRILVKKFELGLFEHPFTDRRNLDDPPGRPGRPGHLLRGRLGPDGRQRRRHRGRRRDALRRGLRRRRRAAVAGQRRAPRAQDDAAERRRPGRRRPGLRRHRHLRGRGRLRPAHDRDRPAPRDGRPGRGVAPGQPGRGRGRRPVRPPAVHRPPVHDLAPHPGAGADQRRRPRLPPAVPVRLGAGHQGAVNGWRLCGTPARSAPATW
jgi:beta-glucosidase-like glycosyl hydrolase